MYRPEGWIEKGGVVGAALGFAIGGVMIFFVGLTYAELTAAMPQCGGEHVFSHRAMGPVGSFVVYMGDHSWICRCYMFEVMCISNDHYISVSWILKGIPLYSSRV